MGATPQVRPGAISLEVTVPPPCLTHFESAGSGGCRSRHGQGASDGGRPHRSQKAQKAPECRSFGQDHQATPGQPRWWLGQWRGGFLTRIRVGAHWYLSLVGGMTSNALKDVDHTRQEGLFDLSTSVFPKTTFSSKGVGCVPALTAHHGHWRMLGEGTLCTVCKVLCKPPTCLPHSCPAVPQECPINRLGAASVSRDQPWPAASTLTAPPWGWSGPQVQPPSPPELAASWQGPIRPCSQLGAGHSTVPDTGHHTAVFHLSPQSPHPTKNYIK